MVTRHKTSEWQPGGLELLDIKHLYSDEELNSIVDRVSPKGAHRRKAFRARILDIAGLLNADVHYDQRPTLPQKRAALDALLKAVSELEEVLSKTDPDTVLELGRQFLRNVEEGGYDLPDQATQENISRELMQDAGAKLIGPLQGRLEQLEKIAGQVREAHGVGQRGRRSKSSVDRALSLLVKAWKIATDSEPTLTPMKEVAEAALGPVLTSNAIEVSLDAACRRALYDYEK